MPDVAALRAELRERLSPARAAHAERVATTARELAALHGLCPDWAELAGLLHDWYRETSEAEILRLATGCGVLSAGVAAEQIVPAALHGPVAARLLPTRWPDIPAEVWQAVDRHTTGDAGMTNFDCLIYVADLVEPGHAYPGVRELRAAAASDLRTAARAGMEATIERLLRRGLPIDLRTVAARNALLARTHAADGLGAGGVSRGGQAADSCR